MNDGKNNTDENSEALLSLCSSAMKLNKQSLEDKERPEQLCPENATKFVHVKNFMSGAKRGFLDVNLDDSGKWDLNGGSEADLAKSSSILFSPKSGINGGLEKNQVQQSISPLNIEEKKKEHVTGNGALPSAKKVPENPFYYSQN
ncbi:hypothetical protein L2E82_19273 [Cichorium intybus]|uniref:Uncharacterized protein n=1 Tax=Cichorium intybus TaxID=13427 RepID=A0ACB9FBK7_CICIN|nr:hypothetical protein L2E82_19273 [Cichorium intybus]